MPNKKRALTTKDFLDISIHSDPQITPNGGAYAFVSTSINQDNAYISHIYFQSFNSKRIKQWTFNDSIDSHPRFSPDGKHLVFQSTKSGLPQIWLLNTNGGKPKQISSFKNGATMPYWSNDGTFIIFSARLEEGDDVQKQVELSKETRRKQQADRNSRPIIINRLKHKSDARGFFDHTYSQLILFNMKQMTYKQLTTSARNHQFEDISPDNNLVLFSTNLNDDADYEFNNHLYTLNLSTNQITKLTRNKGSYTSARFSPNGQTIAYIGHEYSYDIASLQQLYTIDFHTNEQTCISASWDLYIGDIMSTDTRLGYSTIGPIWSNDGERLFFIGTDVGATGLYETTLNSNLKVIYKENNHVFGFSYDFKKDVFVLGISTPRNPCNFYLLRDKGNLQWLTNTNTELLDKVVLSKPEKLNIPTTNEYDIQGWLLRPYGFTPNKKYPLILAIHGGPHIMYGKTFFHEMQLLAAKGYVVLYTNPRGSHGYGQEFVNAVRKDYGGKDYTDLMAAVDYVVDNYSFIDAERLGVTGGSYGGFMTNWIVAHTDRFKAAVTQRSISNWISFHGVSDIGYLFTKWELGIDQLDDINKLWDFSPLKYGENIKTPLLILHGEADLRCPIEQSEQLFSRLKYLRKKVEFIRFPDANHDLSRSGDPYMRIERLNHICRWFEQYL